MAVRSIIPSWNLSSEKSRAVTCGIVKTESRQCALPTRSEGVSTLDEKVAFLSKPQSYPKVDAVIPRETHMSWVFLAGDRVYKLKKPVRLPYLDFSTLERRETACRSELTLNRRLASDVYLDVVPLRSTPALSIGGDGRTVDWLVVMRRLDEDESLEARIFDRTLEWQHIDRLTAVLARFYRHAPRVRRSPIEHRAAWRRNLSDNLRVLLDPAFDLPAAAIRRIDRAQRQFLVRGAKALAERTRRIVDGHGDLRPEHVWLGDAIRIIDGIEFNPHLRAVDPFDEIAYLGIECDRLGASWIGKCLRQCLARALNDDPPDALFAFYRCYRATLRARLSIAHLLTPNPRTPEKWPRLARTYLAIAESDARQLERFLNSRAGR